MDNNIIINYIDNNLLNKNLNCQCLCNKKLIFPYLKFKYGDSTYLFNWLCIITKHNKFNNLKKSTDGIKIIPLIFKNNIYYLNIDYYKYAIENYYNSNYIWIYSSSNNINTWWVYSSEHNHIIEHNYKIFNNNIKNNVKCDNIKECLIKFLNNELIERVISYLNLCKECIKVNTYTMINCNCNNYRCKRKACASDCNILNKFNINVNDDVLTIDFTKKIQTFKTTKNKRIINRINKEGLLNITDKINGVAGLPILKINTPL